jgi:hypothetical protein
VQNNFISAMFNNNNNNNNNKNHNSQETEGKMGSKTNAWTVSTEPG